MKYSQIYFFLIFSLLGNSLALESFLKQAFQGYVLKESSFMEEDAVYDRDLVKSQFFPNIDLLASFERGNYDPYLFDDDEANNSLNREFYALKIKQNIFDGGKSRSLYRQKNLAIFYQKYLSKDRRNQFSLKVSELYFELLKEEERQRLLAEKKKSFLTLYQKNTRERKVLFMPYLELINLEKEKNFHHIERMRKEVGFFLKKKEFPKLDKSSSVNRYLPSSLEEAEKLMLLAHPLILAKKEELKALEEKRNEIKAENYPNLDIELLAAYSSNLQGNLGEGKEFSFSFNFSYNIFDGGLISSREKQIENKISFYKMAFTNERNYLKNNLRKAWGTYEGIKKENFLLLKVEKAMNKAFQKSQEEALLEKLFAIKESILDCSIRKKKIEVKILFLMGYLADFFRLS